MPNSPPARLQRGIDLRGDRFGRAFRVDAGDTAAAWRRAPRIALAHRGEGDVLALEAVGRAGGGAAARGVSGARSNQKVRSG